MGVCDRLLSSATGIPRPECLAARLVHVYNGDVRPVFKIDVLRSMPKCMASLRLIYGRSGARWVREAIIHKLTLA